jgi:hypothetical protein
LISEEKFYAFPVQIFGLIHSGEGLLILNTVILSSKSDPFWWANAVVFPEKGTISTQRGKQKSLVLIVPFSG